MKQKLPWRILAVDNGTSHLGLMTMDYSVETGIGKIIDLRTLEPGNKAYYRYPDVLERKGPNAARREWIRKEFSEYLKEIDPDVVAIETPFIGGLNTLSSFEPLSLSLDGLIDEVLNGEEVLDRHIDIEKVAPHEAKKAVTHPDKEYDSRKEAVFENIMNHPMIDLNGWDLCKQSPDAIDAIAIGWTVVTRLARF